jgi:hypothetical protein
MFDMNNGCEYRSACRKALNGLETSLVCEKPLLSTAFFYVNFGQNFGPCSSNDYRCPLRKINKNIEKDLENLETKNTNAHSTILNLFLKEI